VQQGPFFPPVADGTNFMQVKVGIVFLGILLSSTALSQSSDCLSYEPTEVRIVGKVVRESFPGPPNFENIQEGDKPEGYWILKPDKPVCVVAGPDDELNETELDVRTIQLVLSDKQYKIYRNLLNKRIIVTGTLSHGHTGHHHTAVLLKVSRLRAAPRN
jgi:hypothetical protein